MRFAREDTALSHFLSMLICIFRSRVISACIDILGTGGIACFTYWEIDTGVIVLCIVYGTIRLLAAFVLAHNDVLTKQNAEQIAELKAEAAIRNCVAGSLVTVDSVTTSQFVKLAKRIRNKSRPTLLDTRNIFGFQNSAFAICREIYGILSKEIDSCVPYVTIFQRFLDDGKDICKMVAYWNGENVEPITYQNPYAIPPNIYTDKKVEYHTEIFASNDIKLRILIDKEKVREEFVPHIQNKEREERINQYIGIPIALNNDSIYILLQVDFEKEYALGRTEYEVEKYVAMILYPYVRRLHMLYEIDRTIEVIFNRWNVNRRVAGKTSNNKKGEKPRDGQNQKEETIKT